MANTQAYFGFRPVRNMSGGEDFNQGTYKIASGTAATFRHGDLVKLTGTNNRITAAAAGDTPVGVFIGCWYINANNQSTYSEQWITGTTTLDGSDVATALVWDDLANTIFVCQADTCAAGDVGALADINVGTGNTQYQQSGAYLDVGAGTATTGKTWRILGLADSLPNSAQAPEFGAYATVYVKAAEGTLMGISAGAAGV